MKKLIAIMFLASVASVGTGYSLENKFYIRKNYKGTSITNSSESSTVLDGNKIYRTVPGTNYRSSGATSYTIKGNKVYKNYKGTDIPNTSGESYTIGD